MTTMLDSFKSDTVKRKLQYQASVLVDILANIADVAKVDALEFRSASGGSFTVPTGSAITTLTFYVSYDGVTYLQLFDKANAAISRTVAAARAYPLPDELFGFPWFKMIGQAAGTVGVAFKA